MAAAAFVPPAATPSTTADCVAYDPSASTSGRPSARDGVDDVASSSAASAGTNGGSPRQALSVVKACATSSAPVQYSPTSHNATRATREDWMLPKDESSFCMTDSRK